jgi:hypothetical protein
MGETPGRFYKSSVLKTKLPIWGMMFCLPLLFMMGCAKKSLMGTGGGVSKEFILPKEEFSYLSIRSKIEFESPQQSLSANANIRIRKDSAIWVSMNALLGVEAGRILITKQGIAFINRLEKTFLQSDYATLSRKFGLTLSYELLQESLLGNMPFPPDTESTQRLKKQQWEVQQNTPELRVMSILDATLMKLVQVKIAQKNTDNLMIMELGAYQKLDQVSVPFKSMLSLNYRNGGQQQITSLSLSHTRAQLESSLSFPFSIPERYTAIRL